MLKKTITYTDFDGVQQTEDFFFNLTKAELTEMDLCYSGGVASMIDKINKTKDNAIIVEVFKDLIRKAYGEKSTDGRHFMKNKEITDSFTATEAYSELFMEFLSDANAAAAFVNGVIPQAPSTKSSIPAPLN